MVIGGKIAVNHEILPQRKVFTAPLLTIDNIQVTNLWLSRGVPLLHGVAAVSRSVQTFTSPTFSPCSSGLLKHLKKKIAVFS